MVPVWVLPGVGLTNELSHWPPKVFGLYQVLLCVSSSVAFWQMDKACAEFTAFIFLDPWSPCNHWFLVLLYFSVKYLFRNFILFTLYSI